MTKEIEELINDITNLEASSDDIDYMCFIVTPSILFDSAYFDNQFINMFGKDVWGKLND